MANKLYTWGQASSGRLGNGTTTPDVLIPTQIGSDTDWDQISSAFHSLAIRNGTLWAWGGNNVGQIGDGTTTTRNSPVQIGSDNDWEMVSARGEFSLGIRGGALYAWGFNSQGQLGDGTTTTRNSPVQIGLDTDWEMVAAGSTHSLAIKNGDLYTWGAAGNGVLGNGTITPNINTPTRIGTDSDWEWVSAGSSSAGIRNGELYTWGTASQGQLGNGTSTPSVTTPTRIGSDSDWERVSVGVSFMIGLRAGSLWAWGLNSSGQLGDGTTTGRNSPVQIGSDTDWEIVSAGSTCSAAIKSGELYTWGAAANGRLGNNTTTPNVTAPAQIGSDTNWTALSAGTSHIGALQQAVVPPSNTAAPSISGTEEVGETLTASDGTWSGDEPITYSYQWKSADTSDGSYSNISGATSSSYVLTSSEAGKFLKVEVTATNDGGTDSALSAATNEIAQEPANTAFPSISFTDDVLQVGSELTSSEGTWESVPALDPEDFSYQWQVSNDGSTGWSSISGATSSTLTVPSSAADKYIRLEVTADNGIGDPVVAYSLATGYISEDPISVVAPSISGTAKPGETLTASPGVWTGFPNPAFTYQWQKSVSGSEGFLNISGATSQTYQIPEEDLDYFVRVIVTGTNDAGEVPAASAPLGPVEGGGSSTAAIVGALRISGAF